MNIIQKRWGLRFRRSVWYLAELAYQMVLVLIFLLVILGALSATAQAQETYLVVVYKSKLTDAPPDVKIHLVDKLNCNEQAKQVYKNVKAGKVRAFCM